MKPIEALGQFGLTQKEAMVYIACLQIGNGTALKIATKAGLPKSSTHDILRNLNKRGYVSMYLKKNKKYFAATDPATFEEKITNQVQALKTLLPQLKAMHNVNLQKPSVRFYEHKEGVETVLREIAKETKNLLVMSSISEAFEALPEYFPRAIAERVQNKVFARRLYKDSTEARRHKDNDARELAETRLINPSFDFTSSLWMWNNKVVFFNTEDNNSVLIIEDHAISKMLLMMFESMWNKNL